ncbi:methyl-accepting chemotaxis protein [Actinoplanes sp. NEAU-A12]|uniref:Methyl-accepting chemotaxis protein n=1 Tax=Actinoplanes sandaracinus TaxID=3045177 RepID=A0ABT6WMR2_9ACTN|nr:methyl-accepting chemotaxis protein [Actinoplanes sandaracinus]MDI6101014.1 methyl-accepting chemotaxis protein [Actinoplanes sandaracinus]
MPIWLILLGTLVVVAAGVFVVRRRGRRAALGAGDAGDGTALAELTDALRERDAELERLRAELETQAQANQAQQRELNQRLRRRARAAIDDTAEVIGGKLKDVVVQVGAARDAAAATNERVTVTNDAANALVQRARSADEAATALNASLRRVAGIAGVISGIASQTRLLALNATIEAVRAGAAGSGFAVVADEVKSLADTTADSTEQITSTIAVLESDVAQMGQTLHAIISDVGDIEDAMRHLGGIADHQHDIVRRLHRSVDATMAQIGDLSDVAERLERRRHDRLPVQGSVRLQLASRPAPVAAEMMDLSSDGLGCIVPGGLKIAVGDLARAEFVIDGLNGAADVRVVRRVVRGDNAEIGLQFQGVPDHMRREVDAYLSRVATDA